MKGVNKAFAILGALALVAFVGFVSTFGYPLPSTPTDPFELSESVHADSDGTHTAILPTPAFRPHQSTASLCWRNSSCSSA